MDPARRDLQPGERFAHFRIQERIGSGGAGTVYRAIDTRLEREVALKVVHAAGPRAREIAAFFRREATTGARLASPHLVVVYEAGDHDGLLYMSCEFIEGGDLARRLREDGPLPVRDAVAVVGQCCSALVELHDAGLTHRDIKPGNIFIDRNGNAKLGDLGLAGVTGAGGAVEGQIVGTPWYMSPEQLRGEPLDIRADIWSLGATCYALLAGQPPFPGDDPYAVAKAILSAPAPDLRGLRPDVPETVAAVVARMLDPVPDRRYQEPALLLEDLACTAGTDFRPRTTVHRRSSVLNSLSERRPESSPPHPVAAPAPAEPERRGRTPLIAAGATLLVVIGGIAAAATLAGGSPPPPPPARMPVRPSAPAPVPAPTVAITPPERPAPVLAGPWVPPADLRRPVGLGWMSTGGDRHGPWIRLELEQASLRLRPVPPGTWARTSGRTTLTRGFWIMETEADASVTGRRPGAGLTWNEAVQVAERWSAGLAPMRLRLPTEAEWEHACRLAAPLPPVPAPEPAEPAQAAATGPFRGLLGNLSEWCLDAYRPLPPGDGVDPLAAHGGLRTLRGGSWATGPVGIDWRDGLPPDERRGDLGVRLVAEDDGVHQALAGIR
jgi:serine/threonine-protein kinase